MVPPRVVVEDGMSGRLCVVPCLSLLKTPKAKKSWNFYRVQSFE